MGKLFYKCTDVQQIMYTEESIVVLWDWIQSPPQQLNDTKVLPGLDKDYLFFLG